MNPRLKYLWLIVLCSCSALSSSAQQPDQSDGSCISYVPNAISPNGDGINDAFEVQAACELEDFQLLVRDPEGRVVHESRDSTHTWDGSLNGEPLPEGYYHWEMVYADPHSGQRVSCQGELALLH